jgi:hypothetical protein
VFTSVLIVKKSSPSNSNGVPSFRTAIR